MGRNKTRPDGYAPLLEFYVRAKPEGGKLLVPPELRALPDALSRRECLVLVHGFNNTDSEAADAYFGFRLREKAIFATPDLGGFERRFGDTYWPGDADWWSFFDKVDFLIDPSAVHTAVKAANELVELLWQMPNLERVDFIGHSLGCRVTLETLLLLRTRTLPLIGRVVLMAAAVPSEMLERNGKFFNLLMELWAEGIEILVLHSTADKVLHFAFPPGQALAGGKEASDRALGRFGPSGMMPEWKKTLTAEPNPGADHSDYWGDGAKQPSATATLKAGTFLKLGDLGREIGSAREMMAPASLPEWRDIGEPRELAEVG